MIRFEQTGLEQISFGETPEDNFTVLVNKLISPNGIDFEKLRLTDPRMFDNALDKMGCIVLLNELEIDELVRRNELSKAELHKSLYELAKNEGLLF